jgi:ParB family transcriptional regulator, chromosome partitioning protein
MTSTTSQVDTRTAELRDIPVDLIDRNPENPRLIFRSAELEELLRSIQEYGVQVPISVYKEAKRFVLIDGERRWRCSLKLNKKTIPALVQEKPSVLGNLLLMFNIHSLREQWDLLTTAAKLPRVIELLTSELSRRPTEAELADRTGLSRSTLRRSKLLIDLPEEYRAEMLMELKKPKSQQKLTEDFFIEMERALTTVSRSMPQAIPDRDRARRVLISKYRSGVIRNRTDFRYLAKIARASRVEADERKAERVLEKVFAKNEYSLEDAYEQSVSYAYTERDLLTRIRALSEQLESLHAGEIEEPVRGLLRQLVVLINRLLKA